MCDSSVRLSLVRSLQLHLRVRHFIGIIVVVATKPRHPPGLDPASRQEVLQQNT